MFDTRPFSCRLSASVRSLAVRTMIGVLAVALSERIASTTSKPDSLTTADGGDHAEAGRLQHLREPVPVGALVIDDQNLRFVAGAVGAEVEPAQARDELVRGHRLDEVIEGAERNPEVGIVDDADHDHRDGAR